MRVAGVPVLIARPEAGISSARDQQRPAVLWMHGFRADALAHAAELDRCAAMGFVAVGVDAVDHGARAGPALAERLQRSSQGALPVMLDVVDATVLELPAVIDALVSDFGVDRTRVSMVGISMGAFLVYRAITISVPLKAAVALLGSPEWPGETSAHGRLDRFRHTALLSVTAEHDVSVPPPAVHRLHDALTAKQVGDAPQRHHVLQGAGHLTNAMQWGEAMTETMAWLDAHGR